MQLHEYCCRAGLAGEVSKHMAPELPHRVSVSTALGTLVATAGGATPEAAASAMLRRLGL
jgi:hypothetical protein